MKRCYGGFQSTGRKQLGFYKKTQKDTTFSIADFIEKVLVVYTYSMEIIYLALSAQVAVGTFFMKSLQGVHEKGTIVAVFAQ